MDGLITGEPMRELTEADWVWLENELRTNPVFQRTASSVGAPADLEDLLAWLREGARVHYPEFSEEAFLRDIVAGPDGLLRGHHSVEGLMALNRAVAGQEPPSTDVYGRIRCPVMLVMGTRGMFPREEVERVGRLYPRLRVEWLDCGHVPQAERPDELAALVAEFAFSLPSA